jgi:hypothetical protein
MSGEVIQPGYQGVILAVDLDEADSNQEAP